MPPFSNVPTAWLDGGRVQPKRPCDPPPGTIARPTDLVDDSRRVTAGSAFLVRGGDTAQKQAFVAQAVERGAAMVFSANDADLASVIPQDVAWLVAAPGVTISQRFAGRLAEDYFGNPASQLKIIGVTGTNGKTTVVTLAQHLLQACGLKSGLIGTVAIDRGDARGPQPAELTTPGAIDLSRALADMVHHGCQAVAMEVSSHALDQGRCDALPFAAGVFTNLTGDHLDYHGTMHAYAEAKAKLFTGLGTHATAIINADDPYAGVMLRDTQASVALTTLGEGTAHEAVYRADVLECCADHSRVRLHGPWGECETTLPLVGKHNVCNLLQAVAAARSIAGETLDTRLAEIVSSCPAVPGRLEPVRTHDAQPAVLVDYAHTHDALANVLRALRPVTPGNLIVLIGCGGDRDKTKRPKMAAVACESADAVYLTSDNPRSEDPETILADMQAGIPDETPAEVSVILDRAEAITAAIDAAEAKDTVLIAGKGHEDYQIIADPPGCYGGAIKKIPFDDRKQASAALHNDNA